MLKRVVGFVFAVIIGCAFVQCASIGAPTGGPRDSLPPVFLYSDPQPFTTNVKANKILLTFNEYIQLKDQNKIFFMSPPAFKKPILTIKGKSVLVEFQEPLDSNATYRLDFGSSIADNNEGNPMDNFSIVFSTGDVIDSLIMASQVVDAFTRDTVIGSFIFYFDSKADSAKLDSLMLKSRAEALFRSDSSGYVVADILKDKRYRIYALQDANENQRYEPGIDKIAFLDSTYNPIELRPFSMDYNAKTKRWQIDSVQALFEVFLEKQPKKQIFLSVARPNAQKLNVMFNANNAKVDSIIFDSIPDNWVMKRWNPTGDTLTMWIAPQNQEQIKALPDSIKARLVYQKQDSVWNYNRQVENVSFAYKAPKSPEEIKKEADAKKEAQRLEKQKVKKEKKAKKPKKIKKIKKIKKEKKLAKPKKIRKNRKRKRIIVDSMTLDSMALDSTKMKTNVVDKNGEKESQNKQVDSVKTPNPFQVKVYANKEFVPKNDMIFEFEFPIKNIDRQQIKLQKFPKVMKKGKVVEGEKGEPIEVKYSFEQDTINELRYVLKAKWEEEVDYKLFIPSKVFENIAFQSNDTLSSEFTVMPQSKYGTITVSTKADSTYEGCYMIQLIQKESDKHKIIGDMFVPNVTKKYDFNYLDPGKFRVRVIQDINCNKEWDTGDMIKRVKPEKTRVFVDKYGKSDVISKQNWVVEIDVDYNKMFQK